MQTKILKKLHSCKNGNIVNHKEHDLPWLLVVLLLQDLTELAVLVASFIIKKIIENLSCLECCKFSLWASQCCHVVSFRSNFCKKQPNVISRISFNPSMNEILESVKKDLVNQRIKIREQLCYYIELNSPNDGGN